MAGDGSGPGRASRQATEDDERSRLLEDDPAWRAYVADLRQRAEAGTEAAKAALADLPRRARQLADIWHITKKDK